MSKYPPIETDLYEKILLSTWNITSKLESTYPTEIAKWIKHNSIVQGVPNSYISIPLLTAVSYCMQHSLVTYDDIHSEPVLLYGLVIGRSGTNKSAALKTVMNLLHEIVNQSGDHSHTFDSGTMDGLLKRLRENDRCILASHDEFATFNDSIDKGSSGSSERSRFLSLFSATDWQKDTKTCGSTHMVDPRFSLIAFTQPYYAIQFSQNNNHDGFMQRFLLALPDEVFISMAQKKAYLSENVQLIEMEKVLSYIYNYNFGKVNSFILDNNAKNLYDNYQAEVLKYRQNDRFEECRLSVKSKSLGLTMRIAAIISNLRNAVEKIKDESYVHTNVVTQDDWKMAFNIVDSSVKTAFNLLPEKSVTKPKNSKKSSAIKSLPLPDAENLTIDFLKPYHKQVKRILTDESMPLSAITRDKIYPLINNESGSHIGRRFVNGLEYLGFGRFSPNSKSFKRHSPDDDSCPDRENLRKKYKLLNIDI